MIALLAQIAFLVVPLLLVVTYRIVKMGSVGRLTHYVFFAAAGLLHGYLTWFAFLLSEWRPEHTLADALETLPRGGLRMSGFFLLAYVLTAAVIDVFVFLRSRRRR